MFDKLLTVASLVAFSCLLAAIALLAASSWKRRQPRLIGNAPFAAETVTALVVLATLVTTASFIGLGATLPASLAVLAVLWLQSRVSGRSLLIRIVAIAVLIVSGTIAYYVCLRYSGVWLRESYNHDLILYVRGGQWALDKGTLVDDSLANLGTIAGRATSICYVWIGNACSLNRSGTHILAAIPAILSGVASPFGACIGVLILAVPLVSALRYSWAGRGRVLSLFGAFVLVTSPPVLSALWNGNIATAAGAIVVIIAAVAAMSGSRERTRLTLDAAIIGLCAGLGANVYSESMWMALGIGALFYLRALIASRSLRVVVATLPTFLLCWLLAGNLSIVVAVRGVLTVVGEVTRNVNWQSYYLDQDWWSWFTVPFAGQMTSMDSAFPVFAGYVGAAGAVLIALTSARRVGASLVLLFAALAFAAIEITSYRYGANKVVQLLGALPLVVGVVALGDISRTSARRPLSLVASVVVTLALLFSIVNFPIRADDVARRLQPKAIASGAQDVFAAINEDDVVLINDMSWTPDSRFSKTNWSLYLIQAAGGVAVAGPLMTDPFRGGYHTFDLNDTLRLHDKIQWALQSPRTKLIYYPVPILAGGTSFELADLRGADVPAVYQGTGWYEREEPGTWTSDTVTLYTSRSDSDALTSGHRATLRLEIAYFNPPAGGTVSVIMDGVVQQTVSHEQTAITIDVPVGYHGFALVPSWPATSPQALGQSTDSRNLFAMIKRIDVNSPDA